MHMLHVHPAAFGGTPIAAGRHPASGSDEPDPGAVVRGAVDVLPDTQARQPRGFADDGRDGSKYIGQFARENGRYGSMPMHDDYSDEGDA